MANVAVAIDFGNFKLRVGVNYNNKVEIIKNEENYSSFSQMIIATEKNSAFGIEAEKNYAGNYDNCFKEFKYNILNRTDKSNYRAIVIEVLKYYKLKSEDYVQKQFNKKIKNIDRVFLAIPFYDQYNNHGWKNFLMECSKEAGFKEIFTFREERAAICFYDINIADPYNRKLYCLFNLGSVFFVSYVSDKNTEQITSKQPIYERLNESNGGRNFFPKLQNLFDQKLKQRCENVLKTLLKAEHHNFEERFNNKNFTENKKYLAECYKKYRELLNSFSGTAKSIQLEFRHILVEPIEIEITRDEINQVLEDTHREIQQIIDGTKKFLQEENLNLADITLLIIGNGFKFPGVKDLFQKEYPDNFHQRQVFYDEAILTGALQMLKF